MFLVEPSVERHAEDTHRGVSGEGRSEIVKASVEEGRLYDVRKTGHFSQFPFAKPFIRLDDRAPRLQVVKQAIESRCRDCPERLDQRSHRIMREGHLSHQLFDQGRKFVLDAEKDRTFVGEVSKECSRCESGPLSDLRDGRLGETLLNEEL